MTLTRKEFLSSLIGLVAGAGGAAVLAGCGGGGAAAPDAGPVSCTTQGTGVLIETNHGHALSVSKDDVVAGVDRTYDITGSSAHPHAVTITAAMFKMLQGNTSVSVTSTSGGGHTHSVTVQCA
jgi:hypothetical protein